MAKRRRRKITIKNSSLFAFFALISLILIEDSSAYQSPYNSNNNQQKQHYNQHKRHYGSNQAHTFGELSGAAPYGREENLQSQLRSDQLPSFVGQQNPHHQLSAHELQQPVNHHNNNDNSHHHLHQNRHQHHQHLQNHHHNNQHEAVLPSAYLCSNLPTHLASKLKLCKLISHSPAADDVVSLGASKGLAECRSQFKHDRWNCAHAAGDHQLLTSELTQSIGNPESGFIHAIAAAGIVHSIATACSVGNLSDCACDKSRVGTIAKRDEQPIHWKWGGCSNNIRHGMMFAKHLVELLDAVHQHSRLVQLQQHHNQPNNDHHQYRQQQHHMAKRSTIMLRDRLSDQRPPEVMHAGNHPLLVAGISNSPQRDLCQQNQNISQAKHHELIKSLLSRNSLEKHQEFRLAMNMHNNKIGRMAVAKNMELHCRCHGLSGSCSLKTCWLSLPSFQVIGRYLKKKYESSVHLPKAVNLNKLIPMMDRQEISAILSSQESATGYFSALPEPLHSPTTTTMTTTTTIINSSSTTTTSSEFIGQDISRQRSQHQPAEYAALVQSNNDSDTHLEQVDPIGGSSMPIAIQSSSTTALDPTNLTETTADRHELQASAPVESASPVEIPNNLEPLSQQQYQALLRDMKLCTVSTLVHGGGLQTRDLNQYFQQSGKRQQQQHRQHQQQLLNGQQTKQANQQLSHLLPTNDKDELIHLHKSPKYCDADLRHGFAGIQSRVCSNKENAPDNCDRLCCGRGHRMLILHTETSCNCKFQYCCSVICSSCRQESRVLVCN